MSEFINGNVDDLISNLSGTEEDQETYVCALQVKPILEELTALKKEREEVAKLKTELAAIKESLDSVQVRADQRVDEMSKILIGYVMDKCRRKMLIIDPDEIERRFTTSRITLTPLKDGRIRYRVLKVK